MDKHEERRRIRLYRRTNETCNTSSVGVMSEDALRVHIKNCHPDLSAQREGRLALTETARSHEEGELQISTGAYPTSDQALDGIFEERLEDGKSHHFLRSSSGSRSLPDSRVKPSSPKCFRCEHCSKTFTRLYNLKSHMVTHDRTMSFSCNICKRAFARKSDAKRHMRTHSGEKSWVCGGCLMSFSRKDILNSHHKTRKGQACLQNQQRQRTQGDCSEEIQSPKILSISSLLS